MNHTPLPPQWWLIEPEDRERDAQEAAEAEIYDDDVAFLAVLRDADPSERIEDAVARAAEARIENRKRLEAEDRGERLQAQYAEAW